MKAIASDFDGTLFFGYSGSSGHGFKKDDLKAIKEFQKKGHVFGVCTGRPLQGILHASKEAMENREIQYDYFIVSTGSIIFDKDYNILYEERMPRDVAKEIIDTYKYTNQVYTHVGNEDIYTYIQKGGFPIPQNVVNSIDEIQSEHILGVSIEGKTVEVAQKIYKELFSKYGDVLNIFINASDIDIVNKGVSKGVACQKLKEILGIDTLYGIGDNYNDIPMLESTDFSFTFTYSPKEVQDKANAVVENLNEAIHLVI